MKRQGTKSQKDPLKLTCTKSDCKNGLHAYRPSKAMIKAGREGECLSCHQKLLDFSKTRERDLDNIEATFELLRTEYVRHWFWTAPIVEEAKERAVRNGRDATAREMEKRLRTSVGSARPFHDGYQTPIDSPKNIVYWAQHATASCCRRCMEYWHGIAQGHDLTEEETAYLLTLAMRFIDERLPELANNSSSSPDARI